MSAAQKGWESSPERSGWSLKRAARRLFIAKYSSVLHGKGFSANDMVKINWNWYQISGFIGGSELEFLCSFSFPRH